MTPDQTRGRPGYLSDRCWDIQSITFDRDPRLRVLLGEDLELRQGFACLPAGLAGP